MDCTRIVEAFLTNSPLEFNISQEIPWDKDVVPVECVDGSETEEACGTNLQEAKGQQMYLNNLRGKKILHLKGNSIPRGLVPLENLFDPNDVAKEPQLVPSCENVEDVNIGTEDHPNMIKISRTLSPEAKHKYV